MDLDDESDHGISWCPKQIMKFFLDYSFKLATKSHFRIDKNKEFHQLMTENKFPKWKDIYQKLMSKPIKKQVMVNSNTISEFRNLGNNSSNLNIQSSWTSAKDDVQSV